MARHASIRLRLVAASAALVAGFGPLLPSTAAADVPQETVVPATLRSTYTSAKLYSAPTYDGHDGAGTQGVFHTLEGHSGMVWTRYADGTSVPVTRPTEITETLGTGGDVIAYRYPEGRRVDLWNAVDGTTRTIHVPSSLQLVTAYADLAVGYHVVARDDGTLMEEMHLLTPEADGTTRDVRVSGLPEGVELFRPVGGDATGLLFVGSSGEQYLSVMVDRRTGQVQSWTPPSSKFYPDAQVTADHVVLFNSHEATVQVYPRSDLSAAPVAVTLDGAGSLYPAQDLAVVGDWLVHRPSAGTTVKAKPIAGGASVTVLTSSDRGISAVSDGTAVALGRTSADDWGIQRIQPGPDGRPVVTQVKALPKPPVKIQGLALDNGRLLVTDGGMRDDYVRTVAVTGTPQFGERTSFTPDNDVLTGDCAATDVACSQIFGTPDGRIAWLHHGSGDYDQLRAHGPAALWEWSVPKGGRITDVSGRYVIYTTATRQYVYRIGIHDPVVTRTPGAAALSGTILWTAGATPGSVAAYDLAAGKTIETLTTDAGCAPTELQANGRWLYWACDGKAGVYDRTSKKSVATPAGEAKLGDGFVVTHDKQAGKLTLTTFADGTAASQVIGDLPDTGVSQRDVRWTVDESGANAAYVDDQERVHLVPSGVQQQPLRLLAPVRSASQVRPRTIDTTPDTLTTVLLSKPSASWRLTVRSKATGKVVDTRDGGAARGELRVGWHGIDSTLPGDAFLPNGWYDWTLSVAPADGVGAPVEVRGTVQLMQGRAVHHDYVGPYVGKRGEPDGTGDLLTLNSSGGLTFQQGTGKGTFSGKVSGSGWPTSIKAVPFGDLSGDRCNDVLVRLSSGALRLYKPDCGAALKPTTAYTTLGTSGWNQYDMLTSPGDISGDGRPDLVARNASTGDIYLYKGTSTGKLSARVKIFANWKTYKKIVGVGDITGDGIGDLIAQDKSNNLYRYNGTSTGTFKARAQVFTNWGGSYNAIVGVGDITDDGKPDIVSRDTSGNLYRNNGDGKGSFGGRTQIGTGWGGYTSLS
ncbi:VCBS repeat-containing protein [Streptomyces yaanensis]|uniref:VCBS repeat-containing protein n=1 Tax=Streptomyces yaanensis TaxID=1142239 RepID=A0ABV7SB80_9ACTN|nr:VCBS repeat-containing protein [Streptomyces sp. CGMCC 4.7035]WNB96654.1 VCBS repeat-containing protein [Streptomyces sp. CGMCC 4.7035]